MCDGVAGRKWLDGTYREAPSATAVLVVFSGARAQTHAEVVAGHTHTLHTTGPEGGRRGGVERSVSGGVAQVGRAG